MTISYTDFKKLSSEQQKDALDQLRNEIGVSALIKLWGISRSKMYNLMHDLGIPVSPKGSRTKNNPSPNAKNKQPSIPQPDYKMEANPPKSGLEDTQTGHLPYFSVSLTAQGPIQEVSEKMQFLFQHNFVPNTNVRVTVNIDEVR